MIPILYEKNETTFTSNGLGRLRDCTSCVVTEERNGIFECDFEYPVSGAHFDDIRPGRIIACEHEYGSDVQPFDIVSASKPINGIVQFHAVHISYRQSFMVVNGRDINNLVDALELLKNAVPSNPFTYWTDQTGDSGFMAAADGVPRSVRQLLGGMEGSILDTYGGEYEFDRFRVRLWEHRGKTQPITIRYGVNMLDFTDDIDYSEAYTSVIPFWSGDNGSGAQVVVQGDRVDSPFASYNGRNDCVPLDLTDKFEKMPTKADLETLAARLVSKAYLPSRSIKVNFVRLEDTVEYEKFKGLHNCRLCDEITIVFPMYDVEGQFKIVKTAYNVLLEKYDEIELGNLSTSLSTALGVSGASPSLNGGSAVLEAYPVGSYYETSDLTFDPNVEWGGQWELEVEGKVHVSAGTNYVVGDTGGEKEVTLATDNIPRFTGAVNLASNIARNNITNPPLIEAASGVLSRAQRTGRNAVKVATTTIANSQTIYDTINLALGSQSPTAVENMQPYIVVNRWHRTA